MCGGQVWGGQLQGQHVVPARGRRPLSGPSSHEHPLHTSWHPHICTLPSVHQIAIVLEYMDGGSLADVLAKV